MTTTTQTQTTETQTTPCAWCDGPVPEVDHGQIVYCSEVHRRLAEYIPEADGNIE